MSMGDVCKYVSGILRSEVDSEWGRLPLHVGVLTASDQIVFVNWDEWGFADLSPEESEQIVECELACVRAYAS